MSKYVFDIGVYGVVWDDAGFSVTKSGVCVADVICEFPLTPDGLSLAIYYATTRHGRDKGENKTPEAAKAVALRACEDAARIFAMGRAKSHRAWLEG